MSAFSPLLDLPPFPPDANGQLADRVKRVLSTCNDVVFVQAEAILALEAAATSLSHPGRVALNVVTSQYGGYFGAWLRRAGTDVVTVTAEAGLPVTVEVVRAALEARPDIGLVAMVHAETSSGILNPLPEIAAIVRSHGALFLVDAVASVGGHQLDVDAMGIDVCVIGAQKALAGPSGLSMVSVSPRAWEAMRPLPASSNLSLFDLKTNWLDRGRGAVPGMPSALEFWALDAALDRVEAETLQLCIERHRAASSRTRAGLRALGATLWIEQDAVASTLATAVRIPAGLDGAALVDTARSGGASLSAGIGAMADHIVRIEHTGQRATPTAVLQNLTAYAVALRRLGGSADLDAMERALRT